MFGIQAEETLHLRPEIIYWQGNGLKTDQLVQSWERDFLIRKEQEDTECSHEEMPYSPW